MVSVAQRLILKRKKAQGKRQKQNKRQKSGSKEARFVTEDKLQWKPVQVPDTLDDYEGFYGLEEIDGVDVKVEDGKVKFVVRGEQEKETETEQEQPEETEEQEPQEQQDETDSSPEAVQDELDSNVFSSLTEDLPEDVDMPEWSSLQLSAHTLQGLQKLGFTKPTEIQKTTIPLAMDEKDVIGKAITGSGKTLAYGIPILEKAEATKKDHPNGIIFTPTRELANQVMKHLQQLFKYTPLPEKSVISLTGGLSIQKQERLLGLKPRVIIATPGRFLELLEKKTETAVQLASSDILVFDEADRLLQDGHFEELTKILEILYNHRPKQGFAKFQSLVFSATFSKDLFGKLARSHKTSTDSEEEVIKMLSKQLKFRSKPEFVDVNPTETIANSITEAMIPCGAQERDLMLYYFLTMFPGVTLVFANAIDSVKRLAPMLNSLGVPSVSLHSSMIQKQRLRSLERFKANSEKAIKENKSSVLIASDVAARGLDIPGIHHVVHYHIPRTADTYIHRSGRTARAGKEGVSIILCSPNEASGPLKQLRKTVSNKDVDDMKTLPLEMEILDQLRERLELSAKLAQAEINNQVVNKEKSWIEKAADELGIEDLSDLEEDDFLKRDRKRKEGKQLSKQDSKVLRAQLKQLLNQPLRKGGRRSYIAGGLTNVADILARGSQSNILGYNHKDALDSTDSTESLHELRSFGRSISNKFKRSTVIFVVFSQPFQKWHFVHNLHLLTSGLVEHVSLIFLRRRSVSNNLVSFRILQCVSNGVKTLINDDDLTSSQIKSLKRIVNSVTEFTGILRNLVKVLCDQFLFLDKLDVGQSLSRQLDGLVKSVFSSVRDINQLQNLALQSTVKHVGSTQLGLEISTTGQNQSSNSHLVVRNEVLNSHLGDFSDIVVSLLVSQSGETQCRLSTSSMLLRQINCEFVQNFSGVTGQSTKQGSITVHHNETKSVVTFKQFGQRLGVELVITQIQRGIDRLERLESNGELLFFTLLSNNFTTVHNQSVWRNRIVQLEFLLGRCDCRKHRKSVHTRFDVGSGSVLISQHFLDHWDLTFWRNNQRNHRGTVTSGLFQRFDQFLDLPHLDVLLRLIFSDCWRHVVRIKLNKCLP
ncbi:hypothetical protein OGAPHI_007092 [Ogataea philodendri]|uniref:RNA helicase n=1 Tax=Ogataea philodendri TaxID=1378263 RepID=A0A9P8NWH5_9ASCO|nr:uncharacterized protein OGAPHI_007092 [Ogataea philodendri]KAH3660506.1 hypothetical protein OGAPHI_007092 [Ogataea philodendri]